MWESLCTSALLKNTPMILILNKIDVLKQKLESGIRFKSFISSYSGRRNDAFAIKNFLLFEKFGRYSDPFLHSPDYAYPMSMIGADLVFKVLVSISLGFSSTSARATKAHVASATNWTHKHYAGTNGLAYSSTASIQ
ncbi:G-protein alpha subunit-domain-containing protein [Gymnopilus junonius]|uniref:G-protein alpha subunit-domain-containing protein n=1 Tax=Gymnopilus junonius TaxID=109634 RepID=A0A9P5P054_GYMJU|nr:G-protein alpha subunit-domain-containing protein [Gymnopilus junonius]